MPLKALILLGFFLFSYVNALKIGGFFSVLWLAAAFSNEA